MNRNRSTGLRRSLRSALLPMLCLALSLPGLVCAAEPGTATPAAASEQPLFHRVPGNLLKNGSFEHNWFNHRFADRRRFLLLQASDMGLGECDGNVDDWTMTGKSNVWDTEVAHSGSRSVRFDAPGSASQLVRFAGETSARGGGAWYAYFIPMEQELAGKVARRPIVVGVWCRTRDVPTNAAPEISVKVECGDRKTDDLRPYATSDAKIVKRSVLAAGLTHDWQYVEVRIAADELESVPWFVTVSLAARGKGTVWFDDVSCVEEPSPDLVNRLPNAGFEALDDAGWPKGWKKPALWTWFRNTYYTFTGWSHADAGTFRGGAVVDRMVAWNGNCSLRMTAFPGDNFSVESEPIAFNQDARRPIEVRAMVKADNLRTLEIMARDESGAWLRQGDFLGDGMQEPGAYNMATTGAGTYDWMCVRKFFSPDRPIQSLTLVLAVRGFDGRIVEDKNIVGTVWVDGLQLLEHGVEKGKLSSRAIPTQPQPAPALCPFRVADLDLGERLWGRNAVTLTLEFPEQNAEKVKNTALLLALTDPSGRTTNASAPAVIVRPATPTGAGLAVIRAEYPVTMLCSNWLAQYRLSLQFSGKGWAANVPPADYFFGTPQRMLAAGISGYYLYADEKPVIYANVNVSQLSLQEMSRCQIVTVTGGKEQTIAEITDPADLALPRTAPEYLNTRNAVKADIPSAGFVVHPWDDPQRDNAVSARLFIKTGGAEKLLAETEPVKFGFIGPFPPPDLPDKIERTAINDKGFITVNGKGFFPVLWRPHANSKTPEANYPVSGFGYRCVDLTSLVYSNKEAPNAEVKAQLLARVNALKQDPRFFQYEIGEGEMQLQGGGFLGDGWKTRLEWCKTAIDWIHEADPNHIVNGPISWLVGHPRHETAMQSFVGVWDAIGVEASFESRVLVDADAKPPRTPRRTAVIVGLETYFYQPLPVLRWRGYRAVLDGAAGIGLCPSGMMESRPDMVNDLRGLNGEFRALAPAIMADEPQAKAVVDAVQIDLMERVLEGKRYLIAVRNRDDAAAVNARFSWPAGFRPRTVKVMFEGRTISPEEQGFADAFAAPYAVHVYRIE